MKSPLFFLLLLFWSSLAFGQTVNLLKDINTTLNASGSSPSNFTNVAGVVFFTATDPERGNELWKTDGTANGTVLVKDIRDGSNSSSPSFLTAVGTVLYFRANDGINGSELWKSDGTANGTVLVEDIYPGTSSGNPNSLVNVNGTLFFSGSDATYGTELWRSDGTALGTYMVYDIVTGASSSAPSFLVNANGVVVFRAYHATYGYELWRSNGGSGGANTYLIEDIYAGASPNDSYPTGLIYNSSLGLVFFSATNTGTGTELYTSGTTAGSAAIVEDIYAGATSSSPDYLVNLGSHVYFAATTAAEGRELWRSTGGTAATTAIVEDLVAGAASASPQYLTASSSTVFFSANDAGGDRELYVSQGTAATTSFRNGSHTSGDGNPTDFEPAGAGVFYSSTQTTFGTEFYYSDFTTTTWLADINPGAGSSSPGSKAYVAGNLFMSANNGSSGAELWMYNGSSTVLVKDINGGSEDSSPNYFLPAGSTLYFQAYNNTDGTELWSTTGTTGGTIRVKDINPGSASSSAFPLAYNGVYGFLRADDGTNGSELWRTNGTDAGTVIVGNINATAGSGSSPSNGIAFGTTVLFAADDGVNGNELWASANGAAPTLISINAGASSSSPYGFVVMGSYVYFGATTATDGAELWRSNGSTAQLVRDIRIGASGSFPDRLTVIGSTLYFSCNNGTEGTELYKSDGTLTNAVLVKDINVGASSSSPSSFVDMGGVLFFTANDGVNGTELWKSTDGTGPNTVMVKDIYTGAGNSSFPGYLTPAGGLLYFQAYEPIAGYELYKSDGSTGGTTIVKDIFSGIASSYPANLTSINNTLYFEASDGTGANLMKTNGTAAGTIVATSTGLTYQNAYGMAYLNSTVIFRGTTNTYGSELLRVTAEPTAQPTSLNISGSTATTQNLSFTGAAGAQGYIALRRAGSPSTDLPTDGAAYSVGATIGSSTVAYVGATTSFLSSSLTASTVYHYSIYSYALDLAVYIYRPHSPLTGNASTIAAEPTTQASTIAFSSVGTTTLTVNFGAGNGSSRLVVAKANSAVDALPADATSYTANAAFGSGSQIGSGNFVVGSGAGPIPITNLSAGSTYHFRVFEFNGAATLTNYNTNTATLNPSSVSTLFAEPTVQSTTLIASSITSNSITLSATGGNGSSRILIAKAGSAVDGLPVDGTTYTANSNFGSGTQLGSGNYIVGSGASTGPFTVSGLSAATTYHFRLFEFNGSGVTSNYYAPTASGNPLATTTLANEPADQPTNLVISNPTVNSLTVSWTAAASSPAGYIVLAKIGTASTDVPVDGTAYSVGNIIGASAVAYIGSGVTFTPGSLTSSTDYHFAVFSLNGAASTINYRAASPLTGNRTTLNANEPTTQPTALIFSGQTSNSITVNFTPEASAARYLIVRELGQAPATAPVDGIVYPEGVALGTGTVVFTGTSSLLPFIDTGLVPDGTYHYAVYGFNGVSGANNYLTTAPLSGNATTLVGVPSGQPTNLVFGARTSNSIALSFTSAAGPPSGYLVLRQAGAVPSETPVNGQSYTAGSTFGTSTVVASGNSTGGPDNGLSAETSYYYAIYSFNGSGGSTTYLTTAPLTGSASTLAVEPIAQPTALLFSNVGPETLTVSFTGASGPPSGYLIIRKLGSAPTGLPQDGVSYATDDAIGDATVAYAGPATTINDGFLEGQATYFFQVFSYNGAATTVNYLTTSPLSGSELMLAYEPIAQPTDLAFTNVTTSSYTVSFTMVDFVDGHLVVRKSGSSPTAIPVDRTLYTVGSALGDGVVAYVGNATTFNETVGPPSHYDIFAYNGTTGTINYLTTTPLEGSVVLDNTPPSFNNQTGASLATTPFTISVGVTDPETGVGAVTLEYKAISSSSSTFVSKAMAHNPSNQRYETTVSQAEIGEQGLEFRVKAFNGQGVQGTSNTFSVLLAFQQQTMNSTTVGTKVEDYKIIAVPFVLTSNTVADVFNELGPFDRTQWRMYRHENGATEPTEILNINSSTVEPGKGYWLISKIATGIATGGGTTVNATSANPFPISLAAGWNQIGNPYLFNVVWADVNTSNGTNLELWTYNGGFSKDTKLDKFEGGFVLATANTSLTIPVAKNPTAGREKESEPKTNPIDTRDWEVLLNVSNGSREARYGGFGMSESASEGFDQLDDFTLPRFLEYVELNHPKKIVGVHYTKDIVPVSANYTWEFKVESNLGGVTELTWDNSYFGNNDRSLVLWDEEEQLSIDMRTVNNYSFSQRTGRLFKVFYGDKNYTSEKTSVDQLLIHSVTPNPTSSEANVVFSLPGTHESKVRVEVLNLLGQRMATVFEGQLPAGHHQMSWSGKDADGNNPPAGVYLVKISAGEYASSKRLMVIR